MGSGGLDEVPWPRVSGTPTLDHTWSCPRSAQVAAVGDDQTGQAGLGKRCRTTRVTVFLSFPCLLREGVSPGTQTQVSEFPVPSVLMAGLEDTGHGIAFLIEIHWVCFKPEPQKNTKSTPQRVDTFRISASIFECCLCQALFLASGMR